MRVLQIGSDRSKQGVLVPGSSAHARQKAYAEALGALDIIGFSLHSDGFSRHDDGALTTIPTNSKIKLFYGLSTISIARTLPRPDIISAQDPFEGGLLAYVISRMFKIPLYIQLHTDALSFSYGTHSVLNFIRLHVALFVLQRADGIRVVSDRIRGSIEKRITPKRPVTVLPIFIDTARFIDARVDFELAEKFIECKTKVLVVARLEPEKNVELALRAFAAAAPQDAGLIIVGDGGERHALESLSSELGISERVYFEGAQDPAEYYKLSNLVLVTSKYEGYGMVIVEALAARKPVLSTDVGVAREAGAIVTSEEKFTAALAQWFKSGAPSGELKNYPYKDFGEYIDAYSEDIKNCIVNRKIAAA